MYIVKHKIPAIWNASFTSLGKTKKETNSSILTILDFITHNTRNLSYVLGAIVKKTI